MRIERRIASGWLRTILESLGDEVFKPLRLIMHLVQEYFKTS